MRLLGVICEYHLFHYGHLRQLQYLRTMDADAAVVAIMSGNFVQRGEAAIVQKYLRAQMAVACGVDLVLELPMPYCMSGATHFATAGVRLLDAIGADGICYGCESDGERVQTMAQRLSSRAFAKALSQNRDPSRALAYRRSETYEALYGESLSDTPNDMLAIEYEMAISRLNSKMQSIPLHREGEWSATKSRAALRSADENALAALLPTEVIQLLPPSSALADLSRIDRAVLAFFRFADAKALSQSAEMTADSAARFLKEAQNAISVNDLLTRCKSKRYSDARLRRMLWSALIGIKEADLKAPPAYTHLLAANERGREALRKIKKQSPFPVLTKPAHLRRLPPIAQRQAELEASAEGWYSLLSETVQNAGAYLQKTPYLSVKNQVVEE